MSKFGVIFDMDGVIVDSNPYHKIAIKQFCKKYGFDLTDQQLVKNIYGRTNKEWLTHLMGQLPEVQIQAYSEEKELAYRQLFKNTITPVKGLIPFLDQLDHHHIARAIGTSAPQSNVVFTLSKTNTSQYFDIILNDTFVIHGKPHPEIYLKAARALSLPNDSCIIIEDSLSGVEAGKASGSKVIGITTTHTREELAQTDLVIDTFDDLSVAILEDLVG
ncbi:MAG: HAD family phosphatase [Bacteroidota bacterium]